MFSLNFEIIAWQKTWLIVNYLILKSTIHCIFLNIWVTLRISDISSVVKNSKLCKWIFTLSETDLNNNFETVCKV